jgi:hypothetical protein
MLMAEPLWKRERVLIPSALMLNPEPLPEAMVPSRSEVKAATLVKIPSYLSLADPQASSLTRLRASLDSSPSPQVRAFQLREFL